MVRLSGTHVIIVYLSPPRPDHADRRVVGREEASSLRYLLHWLRHPQCCLEYVAELLLAACFYEASCLTSAPTPHPRIPLLSLAVIGLRPPGLGGVAVRDNCSLTFAAVCFFRLLTSCSCGCEDVCMRTWVSMWRRRPMQVESSLPLCGFRELNLGLQAWEQVPVPADPSLAPLLCSFPRTRPHLCFCFLFPRYFRVGCAHTEQ